MVGQKDVAYESMCGGVREDDVLSGSSYSDCPFRHLIRFLLSVDVSF